MTKEEIEKKATEIANAQQPCNIDFLWGVKRGVETILTWSPELVTQDELAEIKSKAAKWDELNSKIDAVIVENGTGDIAFELGGEAAMTYLAKF